MRLDIEEQVFISKWIKIVNCMRIFVIKYIRLWLLKNQINLGIKLLYNRLSIL